MPIDGSAGRGRRGGAWLPAAGAACLILSFAADATAAGATGAHPAINWHDFTDRKTAPIAALVFNAGVLLWLFVRFGRRPVGSFLDNRRANVLKEMDEAQELKLAAEGRVLGYRDRAAQLDEETAHLREDLLRIGHDERDKIVADAAVRAEKIRKEADFVAAEQARLAAMEVRAAVVEAALAEAERSLREGLRPDDHARLAERFLAGIRHEGAP